VGWSDQTGLRPCWSDHRPRLKASALQADEQNMDLTAIGMGLLILVMFIMAALYIMRRRSRQGRRKPMF
jgi:hypothetical protein